MKTKSRLLAGALVLTLGGVSPAFAGTGTATGQSPPATAATQAPKAQTAAASSGYRHISQTEMKAIQTTLAAKGFAVKADGRWGKATRAAVEGFQKKNGLKASGRLDQATLAKLGIKPAK